VVSRARAFLLTPPHPALQSLEGFPAGGAAATTPAADVPAAERSGGAGSSGGAAGSSGGGTPAGSPHPAISIHPLLQPDARSVSKGAAGNQAGRPGKPPMVLVNWYVKRLGTSSEGEVLLSVEGKREDAGHGTIGKRPWHSTAIRVRVPKDLRHLVTSCSTHFEP